MSELPGTAAVGIETVEFGDESAGNVSVRVTGRWRRRTPGPTAQPTLVIEADGRRHRYLATGEPPGPDDPAPDLWHASFAIPEQVASDLRRTWLQFGSVIVPLPTPSEGEPAGSPPGADTEALVRRVAALERELQEARDRRDELSATVSGHDRDRRVAEQRAHAEQALRLDLARRLSSATRQAERARQALGDLATAEDRIRALERELEDARRRSDEAEQVAAAATVARERAERERAERERAEREPAVREPAVRERLEREAGPLPLTPDADPPDREAARLVLEQRLSARRTSVTVRVPREPPPASHAAGGAGIPSSPPLDPPPAGTLRAGSLPTDPLPTDPLPPGPSSLGHDGGGVADDLWRELEARARAEAALRCRLIDAEARLATRILLQQRTALTLAQLRDELQVLAQELERERARRMAAEARVAELEHQRDPGAQERDAEPEVDALQRALERLTEPGGEPEPPEPAAPEPEAPEPAAHDPEAPEPAAPEPEAAEPAAHEPEAAEPAVPEPVSDKPAAGESASDEPESVPLEPIRLNDALTRLRDTIAPPELADAPEPDRAASLVEALGRPSLERPFRRMVKADPEAAGRLLLELLALQRVVYPHPIAYDLILGRGAARSCVCVSVPNGSTVIAVQSTPRPRRDVDFQVIGDPARIARLLVAGRLRRRFGLRVARVRGQRAGLAALRALLGMPLDLDALDRAGVRLDSVAALTLVASVVEPAWTQSSRFVLAHVEPGASAVYLIAHGGRPLRVSRTAPPERVATTLHGPAAHLLGVLSSPRTDGMTLRGDDGPLTLLREWVQRAQRGA